MTAVAWHPEKEGVLAFGTDEGKIGTVDVLHSRREFFYCSKS